MLIYINTERPTDKHMQTYMSRSKNSKPYPERRAYLNIFAVATHCNFLYNEKN